MNKVLDVHTAELVTAAVEVKTLTIRGKQVTLAVFRQLEEKQLLLDDGSLAGIPWGRVNYHPDKCADARAHMHLVWQEDSELRRARVDTVPRFEPFYGDGLVDEFLKLRTTKFRMDPTSSGRLEPPWVGWKREYSDGCAYAHFEFDGVQCWTAVTTAELHGLTVVDVNSEEANELEREMATAIAAEKSRRDRTRSSTAMLAGLSQLFIAV